MYGARGVGTLWEPEPPGSRDALADLLGAVRARLLGLLESPASSTELAVRLGVTTSAVNQHLRALRDGGPAHRRPPRPVGALPALGPRRPAGQRVSAALSSSTVVTGRSHTSLRQTYAAGRPVDRIAADQQRDVVVGAVGDDHHRARVPPGAAARARRGRRPAAPTTATSTGPSSIDSAAASDQPGEARRPLGDHGDGRDGGLGGVAVPAGPGDRGVLGEGVHHRRQPGRVGVVGRVARPGDQRLGVVGGVVEAAVGGARSASSAASRTVAGALEPDRVAGAPGRRSRKPAATQPWSSSTPAGAPTTPSRETRRSRPSTTCTSQQPAAPRDEAGRRRRTRRGRGR